jgi:hypothetical protein
MGSRDDLSFLGSAWLAGRRGPESRSAGRILDGRGAIAQLGERLLCKQEVTGSIPVGSTILTKVEPAQFPERGLGLRRFRGVRAAFGG